MIARKLGFTMSEMLVALAVLGIIASHNIPKVLYAVHGKHYNSLAKEALAMTTGTIQTMRFQTQGSFIVDATTFDEYFNYVAKPPVGNCPALNDGITGVDVNGDGVVTGGDQLAIVNWANAFGYGTPCSCPEDVNGDGIVAPGDLLMVVNHINAFGTGPYFPATCYEFANGSKLSLRQFGMSGPVAFALQPDKSATGQDVFSFMVKPNGKMDTLGAIRRDPTKDPTWLKW